MSTPHEVPAGTTWAMARRCSGGRNLLAPDRTRNNPVLENAILYVIARKAAITGTAVHAFAYQPNHEHFCGTDSVPAGDDEPDANYPLFCTTLHSDLARVTKRIRRQCPRTFWEPDDHVPLRVETVEDCWRNLVYILTNPVKSGRVSRHGSYPGAISSLKMLKRRRIVTHRPSFYRTELTADMKARGQEVLPATLTLEFTIPPILERAGYTWETYLAELETRVRAREDAIRRTRQSYGLGFFGARWCRRIDPLSVPIHNEIPDALRAEIDEVNSIPEDERDPARLDDLAFKVSLFRSESNRIGRYSSCRVSTTTQEARKAAVDRHLSFVRKHHSGLQRFRRRDAGARFPEGTYLMRRYYGVTIRGAP